MLNNLLIVMIINELI